MTGFNAVEKRETYLYWESNPDSTVVQPVAETETVSKLSVRLCSDILFLVNVSLNLGDGKGTNSNSPRAVNFEWSAFWGMLLNMNILFFFFVNVPRAWSWQHVKRCIFGRFTFHFVGCWHISKSKVSRRQHLACLVIFRNKISVDVNKVYCEMTGL